MEGFLHCLSVLFICLSIIFLEFRIDKLEEDNKYLEKKVELILRYYMENTNEQQIR